MNQHTAAAQANGERLVVVLGMHRSGTSAVTRGLRALGVELGDRLLPPDMDTNAAGHWEDIDLNQLNMDALRALGTDWHHLVPLGRDFVARLRERGFLLRAVDLLREKLNTHRVFGFKDPRVALLLPFWKEVFAHCKAEVSYVLAIRNPLSVSKSLAHRDEFDLEKSALLWLTHCTSMLEGAIGAGRCVVVDYDALLKSPQSELHRVATALNLAIDSAELDLYQTQFLDAKLRHTTYTCEDLTLSDFMHSTVHDLYSALLDAATGKLPPDAPALLKQVRRARRELDHWQYPLQIVDSLYHFKRGAGREIAGLTAKVEALRGVMASQNSQLDAARRELEDQRAEREQRVCALTVELNVALETIERLESAAAGQAEASRAAEVTQTILRSEAAERRELASFLEAECAALRQSAVQSDAEIGVLRDHAAESDRGARDLEMVVRKLQYKVWSALESSKANSVAIETLEGSITALASLLDYDGPAFVEAAYRLVLGRSPDANGRRYYGARLRAGAPKLQILRELSNSGEGRRVDAQIPGLKSAVRLQALATLPIVGNAIATICRVESEAPLPTRVRALQQQLIDTLELRVNHIGEEVQLLHEMTSRRARQPNAALEAGGGERAWRRDRQPIIPERPVVFQIEYAVTASPASVGASDDTRELAVGFQRIHITDESSGSGVCDINFKAGGNARHFTLFGFSDNEEWGTWSNGKVSAILAWVGPATLGTLAVSIEATPFRGAFSQMKCVLTSSVGHRQEFVLTRSCCELRVPSVNDAKAGAEMFFGGTFEAECENNVSLCGAMPKISVIILNFNKPQLSLLSAKSVLAARISKPYEVIIVDNGSTDENLAILGASDVPVRVHRIPCNRYFGEGNNLGAEVARGEYLVFLNNDAFLAPQALDALSGAFDADPRCGIAGPVFRYPDGKLQEAGGFLKEDGRAEQRGKRDDRFDVASLPEFDDVDYVSAACLMIRADRFFDLGGFNYRFDPAYYEDTDLCFRVRLRGERVILVREAVCFHIENATTADKRSAAGVVSTVDHNRKVFCSVWGKYLAGRSAANLPPALLPPPGLRSRRSRSSRRSGPFTHATYSPYPLVPGGGERYILATTRALHQLGPAAFVTPDPFSSLRLDNVMFDLGLPIGGVGMLALKEAATHKLERLVVMGNELYPGALLPARRSFFHCQFPFPLSDSHMANLKEGLETLAKYEKVIVNSQFTKQAYERELSRFGRSAVVEVVYPPVATQRLLALERQRKPWILSIGRFSAAGHSKRQDVLIEAMKATSAGFRNNWKLVLCGSVPDTPADRAYFKSLQESVGGGIDVEFVLSASTSVLDSLLAHSSIYAHACGFGARNPDDFSKCEHFGITLVEALVAGCRVICYELGGGPEIIARVGAGETFGRVDELATLFERDSQRSVDHAVRRRASECFDDAVFYRHMISVVR